MAKSHIRGSKSGSDSASGASSSAGSSARNLQPLGNAAAASGLGPVQAKGPAKGASPQAAAAGVAGAGQALPYLSRIQESFGKHDLSGVRAHTDEKATGASQGMGAEAYATGDHVAFGSSPDLHTAAHEAAHVVQQRSGVSLTGGVGRAGDAYEQHADEVADRVVRGESAESLLDRMAGPAQGSGGASGAVQFRLTRKAVSGTAMRRINQSKEAIEAAKGVLSFGAGNQKEALQETNFNSYFRMAAMRDPECWELAPQLRALASQHPDALTAAKADLAAGGNCGEHAQVGFDILRAMGTGETINRADVEGLDHAFVILGDVKGEKDSDLVVCDPWPTAPTACTWEDHFAHTADKSQINVRRTANSDGQDIKSVLAAGLRLSRKGMAMINYKFDDERTQQEIEKGTQGDHPWIWQHRDAASTYRKYEYYERGQ